jgi:hypothetical protein
MTGTPVIRFMKIGRRALCVKNILPAFLINVCNLPDISSLYSQNQPFNRYSHPYCTNRSRRSKMTKKLLVFSTAAVFMFSSFAFAGGKGGNGKSYSGSIGKGSVTQSQIKTQTQIRTQSRLNTNSGTAVKGGTGDMFRTGSRNVMDHVNSGFIRRSSIVAIHQNGREHPAIIHKLKWRIK